MLPNVKITKKKKTFKEQSYF